MKPLISILLVFGLAQIGFGQIELQIDTIENKKVSSIKSHFYIKKGEKVTMHTYGETKYKKGKKLEANWLNDKGEKTKSIEYKYNSNNKIEKIYRKYLKREALELTGDSTRYYYSTDGKLQKVYVYNDSVILDEAIVNYYDSSSIVTRVYRFESTLDTQTINFEIFDLSGNSVKYYVGKNLHVNKYENGKQINSKRYYDKKLRQELFWKYNDNGKVISEFTVDNEGDTISSKRYDYNRKNLLIKLQTGSSIINYKYNWRGLLKKKVVQLGEASDNEMKITEYKYKY